MFSSKNIQMNERKNRSKVTRYAIKKLSMGTASVAVALGFMFVQGQTIAHADTVEATATETTAKPAEEKKDTVEDDKAVYEVSAEKVEVTTASEGVTPAEKTEETTAAAEKKEETTAAPEKKEETTAAAEKKEETTAAPEKKEETTAAAEKKEETTVAEENKPRTRTRRDAGATPAATSDDKVGEDVVDATSTPKVEKPGFTPQILAEQLLKQVSWLDFGDKANWTGAETTADGHLALTVGATYTKEVMPGYIVKIKVKSLKPFQATELYKNRLENQGATDAEKATYDPNAKNGYINTTTNPKTNAAFKNKEEARVIADPQNRWTEIRKEGIDTGTKSTTISSEFDGGNIGVQFEVSATYKGKAVKPAIVMADGESANPGELTLFTTNGSGWQHVGEWLKNNDKNTKRYIPQNTEALFDPTKTNSTTVDGVNLYSTNLNILKRATAVGEEGKTVAWKYYGSPDQTTSGLGTGVFGPNYSASKFAVPVVMTRGASEIGLYIVSSGKQSAMLGFLPLDEGDAPDSYGIATHAINQVNGVTGAAVNQPYLGDTRPDMDQNLERTDWKGDDKDGTGDEGIDQILPTDLKGNTNGMIALDRTRPGNYTLTVQANTGGAPEAYAYGWVDFNQNGKFDENERSEKATITKDGNVTLKFNNGPILNDLQLDKLGVRVRVSTYAPDIESPTGMSMSGEVEDFETQVIFPPKGSKKETEDLQGVKQTATVEFTPRGKQRYSRNEDAVIDETVKPFIVDEQGNKVALDADGFYAVPGEGKYRVTGSGKDVKVEFVPESGFVGTGKGITIRRLDNNGVDSGWYTKDNSEATISDQTNTMDGRYIPTVKPVTPVGENKETTGKQGQPQSDTVTFKQQSGAEEKIPMVVNAENPAKFIDPATGEPTDATELPAMKDGKQVGTYTIDPATGKVTFTPNKDFIGTPDSITVQAKDANGTPATAKYTPTVTPVAPTAEDVTSTGKQGQEQKETPKFTEGDPVAPITINADQPAKFIDPETGEPTVATELPAMKDGKQVGTYKLDPLTGEVTFTPNKDFVGTPDGISVQAKDANGTPATAKYTPTVTPVEPTAEDVESTGKQGQEQKQTPKFTEGDPVAPITINADQPAKFIDPETGEPTDATELPAMKDGKQVGTYKLDPLTGEVTFTPNKDFVGTPDGISVQAKDANGTPATAKYTPTVTPVEPTAEDVESTGKQGQEQKQTPKFTEGDSDVPMKIDAEQPAKFIDPATGEPTDATELPAMKDGKQVGTYTIDPTTGEVTFKPNKDFVGTPDGISVQAKDANGTPVTAKYTPTVTPVTPTSEDVESTGKQGQKQKQTPKFTEGDPVAPITISADNPAKFIDPETGEPTDATELPAMKDGKQVGTYTIDPATGEVTFKPNKDFVGTPDGIKVQAKDANGTPATATYTPTVTPVTPTAEDAETTDVQGKTQTAKPKFTEGDSDVPIDDTVPATFEDGSTTKVIPGVGTFTVAPDGTITFVPEPNFTGVAPAVTIQRVDKNGTVVKANYVATVTPAPVEPAKPAEPTKPEKPAQPEKPAKPVEPAEPAKPAEPKQEAPQQTVVAPAVEKTTQTELPNTGTSDEYGVFSAAALSILASVGLVATSRKKDEEQEA